MANYIYVMILFVLLWEVSTGYVDPTRVVIYSLITQLVDKFLSRSNWRKPSKDSEDAE